MRRIDTLVVLVCLLTLVGLGAGMALSAPPPRVAPPPIAALPAAPDPSELREGAIGPVRTLDPLFAATPAEQAIGGLLFRGLTRAGSDGTVLPDLADRWEVSAEGTVLTFHLRTDARWHDGVHVSADDVAFTYESLADDAYQGPGAGEWTDVAVTRIDRFTVELTVPSALPGFLARTRQPILPRICWKMSHFPSEERTRSDGRPSVTVPSRSLSSRRTTFCSSAWDRHRAACQRTTQPVR